MSFALLIVFEALEVEVEFRLLFGGVGGYSWYIYEQTRYEVEVDIYLHGVQGSWYVCKSDDRISARRFEGL